MAKQKIVIKVSMPNAKSRAQAMVLAAQANGVVASVGISEDRLEVVGEGVDIVCLVNCLRKKLCSAQIVVVEEVKDKKAEEKKKPEEKKPEEPKPCTCPPGPCMCAGGYYYPMPMVLCEEPPAGSCHIM